MHGNWRNLISPWFVAYTLGVVICFYVCELIRIVTPYRVMLGCMARDAVLPWLNYWW